MKNSIKVLPILITTSLLVACGGGGAGANETSSGQLERNESTDLGQEDNLLLKFLGAPLEPSTANIRSGVPENEFDVSHTLSIWWTAYVYDKEGNPASGSFIYDSNVYLSANNILDTNEDELLFSMQCKTPSSASQEYGCSQYASFQCVYNNDNTFNCLSLPLDHPEGFKDHFVDLTNFFDIIPKSAHIFYKICLTESQSCDIESTEIIFN